MDKVGIQTRKVEIHMTNMTKKRNIKLANEKSAVMKGAVE
jgi:hypothetical protein